MSSLPTHTHRSRGKLCCGSFVCSCISLRRTIREGESEDDEEVWLDFNFESIAFSLSLSVSLLSHLPSHLPFPPLSCLDRSSEPLPLPLPAFHLLFLLILIPLRHSFHLHSVPLSDREIIAAKDTTVETENNSPKEEKEEGIEIKGNNTAASSASHICRTRVRLSSQFSSRN